MNFDKKKNDTLYWYIYLVLKKMLDGHRKDLNISKKENYIISFRHIIFKSFLFING